MTRFAELLNCLSSAGVEFILAGGVAATAHGATRATQDIDIIYARNKRNLQRLAQGLAPHNPYLRGAPPGLPFQLDESTLAGGLNFTLTTDLGWIDLLGEISGGGDYTGLLRHTVEIELYGVPCRVLDLDALIQTKRAAGRPKDFEGIAELELLRERRASKR